MGNHTNVKIEERILKIIGFKDTVELEELLKLDSRQSVMYNLRNLHKKGLIYLYINIKDSLLNKQGKIRDDEIFVKLVKKYQTPQEVMALIDQMSDEDKLLSSHAYDDFIKLYIEKHSYLAKSKLTNEEKTNEEVLNFNKFVVNQQARRTAYKLISKRNPKLKETVTLDLLSDIQTDNPFQSRKNELEVEPEYINV